MRSRTSIALLLAGLLAIGVLAFGAPGLLGPLTGSPTPAGSSSAPVPGPPTANEAESRGPSAAPANPSGLPVIKESRLPADAKRTLALIRAGGPYRYSQDDRTFGNFERILPRQDPGYYREYTVPTPGETDRGARRIVAGAGGGKYYTADHYDSFTFIAEGS